MTLCRSGKRLRPDSRGTAVPESGKLIKFDITGGGEIVATVNGNPADLESFASRERGVFNGYMLAIVRANEGVAGNITLMAEADGLPAAEILIRARKP